MLLGPWGIGMWRIVGAALVLVVLIAPPSTSAESGAGTSTWPFTFRATHASGPALRAGPTLPPWRFTEIANGVVLVRTFNCRGVPTGSGSGFFVGEFVVMTARHVMRHACRAKVRVDGRWIRVKSSSWWRTGAGSKGRVEDLATLRLAEPTYGYIFDFRRSPPRRGTNLAMLGHPLGNRLSMTQGPLFARFWVGKVPVIAVRMLSAEGASGAPIVDDNGDVVGIVQVGLGKRDFLGQRTAGLILGIDLSAWWKGRARINLCRAYPLGGIPGCQDSEPIDEDPETAPSQEYAVEDCWIQHTGGSWDNVSPSRRISSATAAELSANGPANYWGVIVLSNAPAEPLQVTATFTAPNGSTWPRHTFTWESTWDRHALGMDWSWEDGRWFYEQPESTGRGRWIVNWEFPDGQTCAYGFFVN